jgi:DNA polymerase
VNPPAHIMDQARAAYAWFNDRPAASGRGAVDELPERTWLACDALKRMWREAHRAITNVWGDLEKYAHTTLAFPGQAHTLGRLSLRHDGKDLHITLPSGRVMSYNGFRWDDRSGSFRYWGTHQGKWIRLHTYGGRLTENLVQALARDVLAHAMLRIEAAGYPIVLTVHDEVICEVPGRAAYTLDALSALLATPPSWAADLPLAAAGFETYRYRKD